MLAVRAPGGLAFNYADSVSGIGIGFAQVFLAAHFNRPEWITESMREELVATCAAPV